MKKQIASILIASVVLVSCGTFPMSREYDVTDYINEAKTDFTKGDNINAANQIGNALDRPTGDTKVKELFASYPKYKEIYFELLGRRVNDVSTLSNATLILKTINVNKSAGLLSETEANALYAKLNKVVANGNTTGSIPIYLGDNIDSFPELKLPEHQQIIVDRSIKNLQERNSSGARQVAALMDYVQGVGRNSAEGKRVESLLPTMNIRGNELAVVAKLFPEFAAARNEEITARVFVQVKNGDRMLAEDILQSLRDNVHGVEWNPDTSPTKAINLIIERVRHEETTMPERSETITYSQSEVNLLAAVLLMPRNASFIYDVVSGGSEIEYGYVVSATIDGKTIHDKLIRGKVGGEYHRCQNIHIKNVFGGETSADFVANDDMRQRCSGANSVPMEDLRKQVLSKIFDEVLEVPPIRVVNDLNTGGSYVPPVEEKPRNISMPKVGGATGESVKRLGLVLSELNSEQKNQLQVKSGLLVEEAKGAAERAGLHEGDIILKIGTVDVSTIEQLNDELKQTPEGRNVALLVKHEDNISYKVEELSSVFPTIASPQKQASQHNDPQPSENSATTPTGDSSISANRTSIAPPSVNETVSQKLRDLQELRKDGIITEDEFQKKKQQLLEKL